MLGVCFGLEVAGAAADVVEILDHHLQTKRRMMKQRNQQKDHAARCEGRPDPGYEKRVIAARMSDDRGGEPQAQRYKRNRRYAFRPPVLDTAFGRATQHTIQLKRMHHPRVVPSRDGHELRNDDLSELSSQSR
jgi:hypothetical protein